MQCIRVIVFAVWLLSSLEGFAADKATSLSDARDAVERNLRTPAGNAYDEQLGTEFVQKHLGPLRQCKQTAGKDLRSFWILLRLEKDGTVKEVLLSPETPLGTCAQQELLKDKFVPPPSPGYWVSMYMNISH